MITIVIPAFNEARILHNTLDTIMTRIDTSALAREQVTLVVADNGSTDETSAVVSLYMAREPRVRLLSVPSRGKGNAVIAGWQAYPADVSVFLDADLSADIAALPELVRMIAEGGMDIAVGSRYAPGAVVSRAFLRRVFSRMLRMLLWAVFRLHVRDAPCGMKAVSRAVVQDLVPMLIDRSWFFDTELLICAERAHLRIVEVPVRWSDAFDKIRSSRVSFFRVSLGYLRAIVRLWVLL